jgi:phosphate transport system protein
MLRDSLTALVNMDGKLAQDVCGRDNEVDQMKREIRLKAEDMIQKLPERTAAILTLTAVSRNLERIADHATNIAEDVIYLVDGRIIRHGTGE